MVRISNYMVFVLNYFIAFFFCFYSVEFIKSDLLDFKILANPKASIKNGVPAQLYIVFYICLLGIVLTSVSQLTNLFYSSIKLMELEFYSDKKDGSRLTPNYKQVLSTPDIKKRITRSHIWQVICVITGGLLVLLIIISITGINLPAKTISIDTPYFENDSSQPVCITFQRDAEKFWHDENIFFALRKNRKQCIIDS